MIARRGGLALISISATRLSLLQAHTVAHAHSANSTAPSWNVPLLQVIRQGLLTDRRTSDIPHKIRRRFKWETLQLEAFVDACTRRHYLHTSTSTPLPEDKLIQATYDSTPSLCRRPMDFKRLSVTLAGPSERRMRILTPRKGNVLHHLGYNKLPALPVWHDLQCRE